MTTPAEDTLYAALTEIDELERLAAMGLPLEAIPTEQMRPVVKWAIDEYYKNGRRQAPTRAMLVANWAAAMEEAGVELIPEDQERDSIDAAIENLKGHHADREWQTYIRLAATDMATAPLTEKVATLQNMTNLLFSITNDLIDTTNRVEAKHGLEASWLSYQGREAAGHAITGMTLGWAQVDTHMGGIRDGELCVLGAGPKTGKSFFLGKAALHEWQQGRRTVLFTLENSVDMTFDRIVALGAGVSSREWQRGTLSAASKEKVEIFLDQHEKDMKASLHVISPTKAARTPEMMVREALSLGAQSILVDQLTHVEHPNPGRMARHEQFNENVHEFKYLISTGRERIPLLLAHQINREGVKASDKTGHLEMFHLAESAGVERAADWVLGLYQSKMDRENSRALLQILASRREDTKAWEMLWKPADGITMARREFNIHE